MPWPRGRPKSPETRQKLSKAMQAYWKSAEARDREFPPLPKETKRKLSAAMLGRHPSPETRAKIREALLRRWDPYRDERWKRQRGIKD